ncbi:WavE lipopolysaccharide synthesis family protein [Aeromonas veronii]
MRRFVFHINNSKRAQEFLTIHSRPVNADNVGATVLFETGLYFDVGILIQGPILTNNNFTLETIRLYRKMFPSVNITLSTWRSDSHKICSRQLDLLRCNLVLSERPVFTGSHNINLQKITTHSGLLSLKECGVIFALKTRTDQRFYSVNTISYLLHLIRQYPASERDVAGRIIELSIATCKFRPWSMCDMFQFGYLSDLMKMWSFELEFRDRTAEEFASKRYTVRDIVNENVAEIFVHRFYAEQCNISCQPTYEDYYDAVRKLFIIIDKEQIDIFWAKYHSGEYSWAGNKPYEQDYFLSRLSHAEWSMLMDGTRPIIKDIDKYYDHYEN